VLTDDLELYYFEHHASYVYPTNIIFVVATFDCETWVLEYDDIKEFLNENESNRFNKFILNHDDVLDFFNSNFENNELNDLSEREKLDEALYFISSDYSYVQMLSDFDHNILEQLTGNIYENIVHHNQIDIEIDHIYKRLYAEFR